MERLDKLEGSLTELGVGEGQDEGIIDIGGLEDKDVKVRGTLLRHVKAWEDAGAGRFALGVIKDGFRLDMFQMPGVYEERNNKSFETDQEFAIEAVQKLVRMEILKEVGRNGVRCINPLTVAINGVGKK